MISGELRAAKNRLADLYREDDRVNGVGIGNDCIVVNVVSPDDREMLSEFEGFPVKVQVVGIIRAL